MFQFDENLTTIVLAVISLISLVVSKLLDMSKNNASKKLATESAALNKEKELKKKILDQREKINIIKSRILLSILRSNTMMLKYSVEEEDKHPLEEEADELERDYMGASDDLKKLEERYILLMEIAGGANSDLVDLEKKE